MNEIKNFYDLNAWKSAHELTLNIYKLTLNFPKEERWGLISQIRRAAVSIVGNIAEGFERFYFKDKIRFYYQARASAGEVQTYLILARDLGFINEDCFNATFGKTDEARQLINGLIRAIQNQL